MKTKVRWWMGLLLLAAACGPVNLNVVTPTLPAAATVAPTITSPASTATATDAPPTAPTETTAPSATPQAATEVESAAETAGPTLAAVTPAPTTEPSAGPTSASPTSTPPPAGGPTAAPATPAAAGPAVMYFVVGPANLEAGQDAHLQWGSDDPISGTVDISLMVDDGARPTVALWRALPANGSLVVPLDMDPRGRYVFTLSPSFPADQPYYEIPLRLPCPDTFFFAMPANWQDMRALSRAHCPNSAAAYPAALEQVFEGGTMLWLQSDGRILVLFSDNTWETYTDLWTGAEPADDPGLTAPEGRFQPQRGLGKVWRENPGVRERLGWALAAEVGFTGADQFDYVAPTTDMAQYRFVRLADGRVVALTTLMGHGYGAGSRMWQVIAEP